MLHLCGILKNGSRTTPPEGAGGGSDILKQGFKHKICPVCRSLDGRPEHTPKALENIPHTVCVGFVSAAKFGQSLAEVGRNWPHLGKRLPSVANYGHTPATVGPRWSRSFHV